MDGMAETGYPFGLALAPQPFFWLPRCQVEAPVAQWIEYCPPKAGVAGSIPAGRTNPHEGYDDLPVLWSFATDVVNDISRSHERL